MSIVFENMLAEVPVRVIKVKPVKKDKGKPVILRAASGLETDKERYERTLRMMWTTTLALS